MSSIDELLDNSRRAQAPGSGLASAPARRLAIVACMDARLDVAALLGLEPGDAHVIRNAGGIVTDDVLRSLLLSQRLLGTREIMLIKHTDCGMQTFEGDELADALERETGERPSFPLGSFRDLEAEMRRSMARIRESPFVPHIDAVRGFVYEVETGRLVEVR